MGEAMAGGIPCVVTDVGDSAWVVGDVGKVVPPKDPGAMAAAWMEFLTMEKKDRDRLGEAGRKRIENNFGLSTIVSQYENVYEKVLACSDEN
ncbi:MAG: glycosyltransferase [Desulfobacterales bacterium]